MAKYKPRQKQYEAGRILTTSSWFGSHEDMVVTDQEELKESGLSALEDQVVCKDDNGYYVTLKSRLDNGLADLNRYSTKRYT